MKGRILFFMIGLLPFLFPNFIFSAVLGDLVIKIDQSKITYLADGAYVSLQGYVNQSNDVTDYGVIKSFGTAERIPVGITYPRIPPISIYSCAYAKNTKQYYWAYLHTSSYQKALPAFMNWLSSQEIIPQETSVSGTIPCGPAPDASCPDTDGDGLCDVCDQWPDDPDIGSEWYLKGYLKYKGEIVGSYGSPSKSKSDYDRFSVADEYAEPDGFPGLGMFVGAAPGSGSGFYVDQDIFQKAGGETVFLSDPPLMFKTSCSPVEDITQCSDAVCQDEAIPQVEKADYPLNNSEIPAEEPYIELDKPYYKPIPKPNPNDPPSTDPCPEHRALCSNTCGGSRKVSNFACAGTGGNSHVICSCDSSGGYEFAPGFSDIGDLSFSTATSTGDPSTSSTFGSGTGKDYDPNTVGSGTDDLNEDGDASNDSYSYEEGQADFGPVRSAYGRLTGKFPFTLADSFVDVFRPFSNAEGSTPTFSYEIAGHVVRFDLAPFNDFARFIRSMFALGLTLSTILALLYIYVGIDFRRK